MSNDKIKVPLVGVSTLLVIFSVLVLTVFSMISLSSSMASKRINDAALSTIQEYYKADTEAEEIFASIKLGDVPDSVIAEGDTYRYSCIISDNQRLDVEIKKVEDGWDILQWRSVSTAVWEEQGETFWNGESIL